MQSAVPLACFLSMIRPPGVQFENSLLQIAPVDKAKCPYMRNHNDVEFRLYTKHNPTVYQELIIDDDEKLFASNIDFHAPTIIHFHAFMETTDDGSAARIRESYILRGDTNIIMVDASRLEAGPWYFTAAENTWYIGNFAAKFIDFLVSRGLDLKKTHLIGHSLGAQSAGVAGYALKSGRVARITGLDPALPLFHGLPEEQRLDKSDAEFVDVIHTDSGIFGVNKPVGHADFYPNGGISPQPGCELEVVIPQQMLLNKCDRYTQPQGYYTYHLIPNKLQNSPQQLFTKIHSTETDENYHQPMQFSKKGEIFTLNTTKNAKEKQEEDQIMIESVNTYKSIPYYLAIRNKDEEAGTMKPMYTNVDNIGTHVKDIDKKGQITIKENTYKNMKDSGLHIDDSQTKLHLQDNTNRNIETVNVEEHYSKNIVKTQQFPGENEESTTKIQLQDVAITNQKHSHLLHEQEIVQKQHSESKLNKKSTQPQTKEPEKNTNKKKQTKHEETTNIRQQTNEETTQKNHVTKRQKRFINPFRKTEEEQQENFLFRLLNFVFKNGRNIPIYSVMREINTLVKSGQGELNHVTKERNNFIGAPPPLIPVTYSLELGNENKAVAFMKRLFGLSPKGDRLTISGTGK